MKRFDLAVIGAGPAGMEAALTASAAGLKTLLLDEQDQAGGQYFRPISRAVEHSDAFPTAQVSIGNSLRDRLSRSPVECAFERKVWNVRSQTNSPDRFLIDSSGPSGIESWSSRTLVIAAGTTERVIPFDGWTTPGVIGLASASILLKAHQMLPGRRTVVAGSGPLLAMVAASIIKGGGEVAAVVDVNGRADWVTALPSFARRPDQLRLGLSWLATIRRAGTPILFRHAVTKVSGEPAVKEVTINPLPGASGNHRSVSDRVLTVDSLVIGNGLTPASELSRLLGLKHTFDASRGGWIPERDGEMQTSHPGLFIAGDCGGIAGAFPAQLQGRLAALAAVRSLSSGAASRDDTSKKLQKSLQRAERFGHAAARLMAFSRKLADCISPETTICRCEGITLREIDAALDDGAVELNQLKIWTGCAMGTCQGRYCSEMLDWRLHQRRKAVPASLTLRARPPVRSLPVEALIGIEDGKPLNLPTKRP